MENTQNLQMQSMLLIMQQQTLAIQELEKKIQQSFFYQEIPAFCTLQKAATLKGCKSARGLYKRAWQQPCCGHKYKRLNGVRVWTREQVIEWLQVDDDQLETYAAKHGIDISKWFKDGKAITKQE